MIKYTITHTNGHETVISGLNHVIKDNILYIKNKASHFSSYIIPLVNVLQIEWK
jgi:hypothetical protein